MLQLMRFGLSLGALAKKVSKSVYFFIETEVDYDHNQ